MEMETGCLLDTEILGEDQAAETSDEVTDILLDSSEEVAGTSSCIPSSMDFEFTNTDLGSTSDFNIDNSSMFDISESVIDEKGDCGYLFKDSNIFEDIHVKQSGELDSLNSLSCINKKASICNDLGLRLQIIPLNNLQFVSTIQTSEGLHILAIPAGSNLNVLPQISSLIESSETVGQVPSQPQTNVTGIDTQTSTSTSIVPVQKNSQVSVLAVPQTTCSQAKSEDKKLQSVPSTPITPKQSVNVFVAQDLLSARGNFVNKRPIIVSSKTKLHNQALKPKINFSRKVRAGSERPTIKEKKIFKESKIVIDLRKLAQTRKKHMVSLLNNPKTKSLLHQHSQKLKRDLEKGLEPTKCQQGNITEIKTLKASSTLSTGSSDTGNFGEKRGHKGNQLEASHSDGTGLKSESMKEKERNDIKTSHKEDKEKRKTFYSKYNTHSSPTNIKIKKLFSCKTCFAKFNREGNYKNHLLIHGNTETKKLCRTLVLNEKSTFEEAERIKQTETQCTATDYASPVDEMLASTSNSTARFACELCSIKFTTEGNLTRHKLTHTQFSKVNVFAFELFLNPLPSMVFLQQTTFKTILTNPF